MQNKINLRVESLRGFCALMVLVCHAICFSKNLNGNFDFKHYTLNYAPSGILMVMVFFMLSGYVIGLRYGGETHFDVADYIKKRLIRLYPIYLFSIGVSLVFFQEQVRSIVANLFFAQNILGEVPSHNIALWSLNHEIVYYVLAIPILRLRIPIKNIE